VRLRFIIEKGVTQLTGECLPFRASAETIRRAHKVHPIAAVEVEYSAWSPDIERNGVLETCRELSA
jgi:aryl-alcohol dehydrogenase-like predicted oxidoreductase